MIASGRVHAVLAEQTRPGVSHQAAELVALLLVAGVVDVCGS